MVEQFGVRGNGLRCYALLWSVGMEAAKAGNEFSKLCPVAIFLEAGGEVKKEKHILRPRKYRHLDQQL